MTRAAGQSAKRVPIGTCDHNSNSTCHVETANRCLSCCYGSAVPSAAAVMTTVRRRGSRSASGGTPEESSADEYDHEPPCAAAAFVASASAAVFLLLAVLVTGLLSAAALWTVASMVATADTADDHLHRWYRQQPPHTENLQLRRSNDVLRPGDTDYLNRWHRPQQPYLEPLRAPLRRRGVDADALRSKRNLQLFKKNREPGVISLTFNLIGGTVSDIREAYRNVTGIVRETINESARTATTSAATVDGDQMMAAGNAMENDIVSGASNTTLAPVNQREAGNALSKLLGRNYRGLRRLFDSELRSAIKNSPGNVRDFAVELLGSIGQSLRPSRLLTRGPADGNSSSSSAAASTTAASAI